MKRIVFTVGNISPFMNALDQRAREHATQYGLEFLWAPLLQQDPQAIADHLAEADAAIVGIEPYTEEVYTRLNGRLKLIVRFGVGYDTVDLDAAHRYRIAVARTTGATATGVAEMALTLMLNLRRGIKANDLKMQDKQWQGIAQRELIGGTVGIIGFGSIGRLLASYLVALNTRVLIFDPYVSGADASAAGVEKCELKDLLSRSDAVSIHAPFSSETKSLIGAAELALMKPEAVLVNTARGGIVEEQALVEALNRNELAGAALDVFGSEPLSDDSPLRGHDRLILSPHVASQTEQSLWKMYERAIDICHQCFTEGRCGDVLNDIELI